MIILSALDLSHFIQGVLFLDAVHYDDSMFYFTEDSPLFEGILPYMRKDIQSSPLKITRKQDLKLTSCVHFCGSAYLVEHHPQKSR